MAKDPVCGVDVDENKGIKREIGGRIYYFCSEECAERFEEEAVVGWSKRYGQLIEFTFLNSRKWMELRYRKKNYDGGSLRTVAFTTGLRVLALLITVLS